MLEQHGSERSRGALSVQREGMQQSFDVVQQRQVTKSIRMKFGASVATVSKSCPNSINSSRLSISISCCKMIDSTDLITRNTRHAYRPRHCRLLKSQNIRKGHVTRDTSPHRRQHGRSRHPMPVRQAFLIRLTLWLDKSHVVQRKNSFAVRNCVCAFEFEM